VLVSASANGKAYNFWLDDGRAAIQCGRESDRPYNAEEGSSPITFPDFSGNF
jgi:hypothetical protein